MKRKNLLLCIFSLCFMLGGCQGKTSDYVKISEQFFAMDTYITYTIYTRESEVDTTKMLLMQANAEFEKIAQLANRFEMYDGIENVASINAQAGVSPVTVDEQLISMVQTAQQVMEQSEGAFSIVLGPISDVWRQYQEGMLTGIPDQTMLDALRPLLDASNLEVNEQEQTIYLTTPGMVLDLGGIAKGYATDYVAHWLEEQGVEHGIVNAGGNVKTIGTHPVNETFRIGLQDPDDLGAVFGSVSIGATSVVTSGDYQRYFEYDGQRYHHLLDPNTLQPARLYRSVSVIVEDSMLADALSTALFVMEQVEGEAFIQRYYPDVAVLWYTQTGEIIMNDAMHQCFQSGGE